MHTHHLGLTSQEVLDRRQQYGSNSLTPPRRDSLWRKLLEKFTDPLIIILLVAMVLSFGVACYEYWMLGDALTVFLEPIGVLIAVLLATLVAFFFEAKSEKEFSILNQVNDQVYYKVYRNGHIGQVVKADIVVGDVIILDMGEEVPADGHLLESVSLQIDESTLTGEPLVTKSTDPSLFDPDATYPTNYICRGTKVLDGNCVYSVDKVGDATEYGRVFEGAQVDNSVQTPLHKQLNQLAKLITGVSYTIAGLVLVGSILMYSFEGGFAEGSWADTLHFLLGKVMIAVALIVVAVPEGLPMSVTLSLAYSMRSMMRTNNLVRKMHACETMGAATVICTDKTGTLTQNRMTVATTHFSKEIPLELIQLSMAINSTAHLDWSTPTKPEVLGNPTEGALLLWLQDQKMDYLSLRETYDVEAQLSFSTERKYMATVTHYQGRRILLVKGAPEIVLALCQLSTPDRAEYEETLQRYQSKAMRTIGFAFKELAEGVDPFTQGRLTLTDMTAIGVVGISDPIRDEVPAAIRSCLDAGIKIKIVTGDTPGTAIEIGRQIGLWDDTCTDRNIITGVDFAKLSDEELRSRVQDIRIMSRARPMDKERLVRLLQEQGEVVAVTGDGTNDAPALKRAQVGLSMGDGTAVSKEASDITILDNSFASITRAVMWGRSLHLNIQRFILFQMTVNVVACLIVLLGAFMDTESPLTVTQMLWVNLIMDTFAALALASLPPSNQVMHAAPRKQTDPIISRAMAIRILGLGIFFVILLFGLMQYFKHEEVRDLRQFDWNAWIRHLGDFSTGSFSPYELTVFFSFFVFLQVWNMFNARAFQTHTSAFHHLARCRYFLLIALVILLGQVVITTLGGEMFRTIPLDFTSWIIIILTTSIVLWVGELGRLFTFSSPKRFE